MTSQELAHNDSQAVALADMLKAIAHPLRLRTLALLCENEANVTELCAELNTPQALVSQHLRILRMAGLVDTTRQQGFTRYRIAEPRLRQLLQCVAQCPRNKSNGAATAVDGEPA